MDQAPAIWDTAAVRAAAATGDYGAVVRAVRRANNITLAALAARTNYSISTLSRLERGRQPLSDVRVLRSLADALGVPPRLFGLADTPAQTVRSPRPAAIVGIISAPDEETEPMRRRTLLTGLTSLAGAAAVLGSPAPHTTAATDPLAALQRALLIPVHGIPVPLPQIHHELATACAEFDCGRYIDTAARIPALLAAARTTRETLQAGDGVAAANALLAQVYVLASRLTVKLGNDQLAWTTADRAMQTALSSDDPLTHAAAHRAWSIVLRRTGHRETAQRLILDTAASLQPDLHRGPQYLTAYGTLLTTAAYTAAVDGHRDTASTLIGEASDTANRFETPTLGVRAGFGPTAVDLYRISIARVLGDYGTAIEQARRIDPAAIGHAERRARYWSDIARALYEWGKPERCYRAMLAAERAAPDEIRYRKPIQQITAGLLQHPRSTDLPGLQEFARRAGI
ncbi:helix-turn-helix domain-containing protein [Nocardia wallacei]|uniref:helix-turn-helix domain-containing protein n=1 Tax=Nocardia wallacei TaxID=480035 RepID=UPI002456060C|nr:helix-turn-helix transcriptional regulator [Nocardia wallacei]